MPAHPETVGNRLELLGLFVNASSFTPEPRLMNERPVRRVHQSDNPVVDMRRQLAGKMRDFVFGAENGKRRRRRNLLRHSRPWYVHKIPNVADPLFARKMSRKNALHFQLVLARKRWDLHALPAASSEPPSAVAALYDFPIEPPVRKRNPAMRARIPHRKHFPLGCSAQHQRHFFFFSSRRRHTRCSRDWSSDVCSSD